MPLLPNWFSRIVDAVTRRESAPVAAQLEAPVPVAIVEQSAPVVEVPTTPTLDDVVHAAQAREAELQKAREAALNRALAAEARTIAAEARVQAVEAERDAYRERATAAEQERDDYRGRYNEEAGLRVAAEKRATEARVRAEAAEKTAAASQQQSGFFKRNYDLLMEFLQQDAATKVAGRLGNRGRSGIV